GLSEAVGFATNAQYYAERVHQKALLRRLLDATQQIAGGCFAQIDDVQDYIDQAEDKIFQIQAGGHQAIQIHALNDLAPVESLRIEKLFERKAEILGVPSGFKDLDFLTSGWQRADLIILAARPSHGKTACAVNLSYHAAKVCGVPVGFISLEQPKEQLVQRLMASTGRIDGGRLRSARLTSDEWSKFYSLDLGGIPIFIVDKPALTILEVRSQARRLKSRH